MTIEELTQRDLNCPCGENADWVFYAERTFRCLVLGVDDGDIVVSDDYDINWDDRYDERFECQECCTVISAATTSWRT